LFLEEVEMRIGTFDNSIVLIDEGKILLCLYSQTTLIALDVKM